MSFDTVPGFLDAGSPDAIGTRLADELTRRVSRPADVVAMAPGRVNIIGEHVDYNGGRCLPLALPHATYAAAARRDDRVLSVTSLGMDETVEVALDDIKPGAVSGWVAYVAGVLWALAEEGWDVPGLDVVIDSRVPLGSGLSSSAALECAVAMALLPVVGVEDSEEVRRTLVAACIRAEGEIAGAPTGGMDQSVALLAEEGHALLLDFTDGSSRQVPWQPESAGLSLLVIDTRVSHALSDGGYGSRRADCDAAAEQLGVTTLAEARGRTDAVESLDDERLRRRVRHVLSEMDRVDGVVEALERGDYAALGPLLDASHQSLRDDYEVSCEELDVAVEAARGAGALGARMTGGGFGGSAVALVRADAVETVADAVGAAFAAHDWRAPRFLLAPAGPGARRLA